MYLDFDLSMSRPRLTLVPSSEILGFVNGVFMLDKPFLGSTDQISGFVTASHQRNYVAQILLIHIAA
jgi:hypothetical protein